MPRVYIIPRDSPNAFATGRNPEHAAVAATEGILRILSPEELEGVMAHELAHVKNRDILIGTIAATFAGAISMLGNMLQWGAMFGAGRGDDEEGGGGLIGSLAMAIIAPIAAMLIQMAVSRSREYLADETGAAHLRPTAGPGQRPAQTAQRLTGHPDAGCQTGHGPHVHRQPADRRRPDVALLHPSTAWRSGSRDWNPWPPEHADRPIAIAGLHVPANQQEEDMSYKERIIVPRKQNRSKRKKQN